MTTQTETKRVRVTLQDANGTEVQAFEGDLQPRGDEDDAPYVYDGTRTETPLSDVRQGVADFVEAMACDGLGGSITIQVSAR